MPINAGYEYAEAQKKLNEAKTPQEKIKALENLLSVSPSHKGAEKLRLEIKTKISKLKEKQEKERAKKAGGFSLSIKKEGAAQIVLAGLTNSGKSTIIQRFTNAKPLIAEYEYTTKSPEIGIMDFNGIKLQLVELPAFFDGFYESEKGPTYFGIIRSADLIAIVLDGKRNCEQDLKQIENEFSKASIKLKKIKSADENAARCIVVVNKILTNFKCHYPVCWVDDFKDAIWRMLGLIYVYTKQPGKNKDYPPVALSNGGTVEDLASLVHKDFLKRFKFARVWGRSVRHSRSNVSISHKLDEGDVVEFHLK